MFDPWCSFISMLVHGHLMDQVFFYLFTAQIWASEWCIPLCHFQVEISSCKRFSIFQWAQLYYSVCPWILLCSRRLLCSLLLYWSSWSSGGGSSLTALLISGSEVSWSRTLCGSVGLQTNDIAESAGRNLTSGKTSFVHTVCKTDLVFRSVVTGQSQQHERTHGWSFVWYSW